MPDKETLARARADRRAGKSPSTQAGEFVREEIHHVPEGKHGARSTKQAIAIGLSKARRAGVRLGAPPRSARGKTRRASSGRRAVTKSALARQARQAARRRGPAARKAAARKAAATRKAA